jgi:hypothetical protein
MVRALLVVPLLAITATEATAAPYEHRVTLVGGVAGLGSAPSVGGGVDGRVWLAGQRAALEVGMREQYATGEDRMVGAIFAGARVSVGEGPFAWRLGFAHNHETPIDVVLEEPVQSTLGTAEGIVHRSGAEVGLAWSRAVTPALLAGSELGERLGVNADLGVAGFPDKGGPQVYAYGGVHLTVGLGPAQSAAP